MMGGHASPFYEIPESAAFYNEAMAERILNYFPELTQARLGAMLSDEGTGGQIKRFLNDIVKHKRNKVAQDLCTMFSKHLLPKIFKLPQPPDWEGRRPVEQVLRADFLECLRMARVHLGFSASHVGPMAWTLVCVSASLFES
eukprot:c14667_g1_i3.p1 GENE.c14667_g1_i3~~c14667_g1_i3.p1  ORF type:complete len:166 (-),score=29.28 c14667_g1_i3:356-781(-)